MNMVSSRIRILMKGTVIYDCTSPTLHALSYILLRKYAGTQVRQQRVLLPPNSAFQ